jgi:hypothetical protein
MPEPLWNVMHIPYMCCLDCSLLLIARISSYRCFTLDLASLACTHGFQRLLSGDAVSIHPPHMTVHGR